MGCCCSATKTPAHRPEISRSATTHDAGVHQQAAKSDCSKEDSAMKQTDLALVVQSKASKSTGKELASINETKEALKPSAKATKTAQRFEEKHCDTNTANLAVNEPDEQTNAKSARSSSSVHYLPHDVGFFHNSEQHSKTKNAAHTNISKPHKHDQHTSEEPSGMLSSNAEQSDSGRSSEAGSSVKKHTQSFDTKHGAHVPTRTEQQSKEQANKIPSSPAKSQVDIREMERCARQPSVSSCTDSDAGQPRVQLQRRLSVKELAQQHEAFATSNNNNSPAKHTLSPNRERTNSHSVKTDADRPPSKRASINSSLSINDQQDDRAIRHSIASAFKELPQHSSDPQANGSISPTDATLSAHAPLLNIHGDTTKPSTLFSAYISSQQSPPSLPLPSVKHMDVKIIRSKTTKGPAYKTSTEAAAPISTSQSHKDTKSILTSQEDSLIDSTLDAARASVTSKTEAVTKNNGPEPSAPAPQSEAASTRTDSRHSRHSASLTAVSEPIAQKKTTPSVYDTNGISPSLPMAPEKLRSSSTTRAGSAAATPSDMRQGTGTPSAVHSKLADASRVSTSAKDLITAGAKEASRTATPSDTKEGSSAIASAKLARIHQLSNSTKSLTPSEERPSSSASTASPEVANATVKLEARQQSRLSIKETTGFTRPKPDHTSEQRASPASSTTGRSSTTSKKSMRQEDAQPSASVSAGSRRGTPALTDSEAQQARRSVSVRSAKLDTTLLGVHSKILFHLAQKFPNETTEQVCRLVIKPQTKKLQCPYVDLLLIQRLPDGNPVVAPATCFISHAWKGKLSDVVDGVRQHEETHPNTYYWFDLISSSQHNTTANPSEWWSTTLKETIRTIGNVLLIMTPWEAPPVLGRLWCLLEIFYAAEVCAEFNVAIPSNQRESFKEAITKNFEVVMDVYLRVDAANAETSIPADKEQIVKVVHEQIDGGFEAFNNTVRSCLHQWYLKMSVTQGANDQGTYLVHNLALAFQQFNNSEIALQYLKKDLAGTLARVGENHVDTASIYSAMGQVYSDKCDYDKALECYQKDISISTNLNRQDHIDTASTFLAMGHIFLCKNEPRNALDCFGKARTIISSQCTGNNLLLAKVYKSIAQALVSKGDLYEALGQFQEALTISLLIFGEHHPEIASIYNAMGNTYQKSDDPDKALECYQKDLAIKIMTYGGQHPDVGGTYDAMGQAYQIRGDLQLALECFEKGLAIKRLALGEDHPDTVPTLTAIARIHQERCEFSTALKYFEQCLAILQRCTLQTDGQPASVEIAAIYVSMGQAHQEEGAFDEAVILLKKAISIQIASLGETNFTTGTTYHALGQAYAAQESFDQAQQCYEKSLGIFLVTVGENHLSTAGVYNSLALLFERTGDRDRAQLYEAKAIAVGVAVIGGSQLDDQEPMAQPAQSMGYCTIS